VSRSSSRPRAEPYPFSVRDPIPLFPVPLRSPSESEPEVDLRPLLDELFEVRGFDLSLEYRVEPVPPLTEEDRKWADALLRAAGLRG